MVVVRPKDWRAYQHYKDRQPPWIKLHRSLLDNVDFWVLDDRQRMILIGLWLIASDNFDGDIKVNLKSLQFRLRIYDQAEIEVAISRFVEQGFLEVVSGDSNALAPCKPEERREEAEESNTSSASKKRSRANDKEEAEQVLAHLNKKLGSQFKLIDSNIKLVLPRLKEHTLDELKAMIDYKVKQWKKTEMDKYLRPQTLFRPTNCDAYVEESKAVSREEVEIPEEPDELQTLKDRKQDVWNELQRLKRNGAEPDPYLVAEFDELGQKIRELQDVQA